ncbi:MAG: DUF2339 domain-containing protein [Sandaracinaceae bacterium]|nr:DUF2339 domain-containing protein [Sandaracinaceae bacterium]
MDEAIVGMLLCFGTLVLLLIASVVLALNRSATKRALLLHEDAGRLYQMVAQLRTAHDGLLDRVAMLERYCVVAVASPVPVSVSVPESESESVPESVPESESESVPESESVSVAVSESVPESESVPVSVSVSVSVPESESASVSESVPVSAPVQQSAATAEAAAVAGGGSPLERFLGVRAAALLGATVLVIAGLYFFKYSIDHGLITPLMRVITGAVVGSGCVVASEIYLRTRHRYLADALDGAGVAILYLTVWSASVLFGLLSVQLATLLMCVVTALCCVLAVKQKSLAIATLGLIGGFATPLLLSRGEDRPIALFAYLGILDVALLYVARKGNWTVLSALGLLGTSAYQALWIFERMDGNASVLGVAILAAFALIFGLSLAQKNEKNEIDRLTQYASLGLPFLFALYFASNPALELSLIPTGILLVLLNIGAIVVARREKSAWLATAAAAGAVGVVTVWWLHGANPSAPLWAMFATTFAIVLAHHVSLELNALRGSDIERALPTDTASLGMWPALVYACITVQSSSMLPWLAAFAVLFALGLRQAVLMHRAWIMIAHAVAASVSMILVLVRSDALRSTQGHSLVLYVLVLAVVVVTHAASLALRDERQKRYATHAAAIVAMGATVGFLLQDYGLGKPWIYELSISSALALMLLSATRLRSSAWFGAVAFLAFCTPISFLMKGGRAWELAAITFGTLASLVLAHWPQTLASPFRDKPFAHRWAAMIPLAMLPLALVPYEALWPSWPEGFVPLLLAAVSASVALRSYSARADSAGRNVGFVWHTASALVLVTAAIPIQLAHEWITIAWAAEAMALVVFWKRLDHVGLKYTAIALFAAVCIRLDANPLLLEYHTRSGSFVLSWLTYTYWVPTALLAVASLVVRRYEVARYTKRELSFYTEARAWAADLLAIGALVTFFVWMNLAISDVFGKEQFITLALERDATRDLARSLSWALYGLALLAFGMRKKAMGLRVGSLVLVILTSLKVFLYDIPNLKDLYRVASLLGLALTLLVISLAYQRVVFQKEKPRLA